MGQAAGTRGAQLEERYFRQKVKLGEGSFGTVWRAVDRQSGDTVAIKQLDKASMPRRGVTPQHVKQEIALMQVCRHENILQLLDKFEDEAYMYLALEYCDGGDFGDKIREQGLGLSEREAADWVRQMCQAVCVLHTQGICHRDIKPDNFMVHKRTNLKLADFGLATVIPEKQLLPGACGTPAFNAPEQYWRSVSGGYSFPVDMWAVGVSMYMVMFGGKHPFMDDDQHLDKKALLQGKLDFRDRSSATGFLGFEGVGGMGLRFSEEARQLCRCLVEPDPHRRLPAQQAVCTPWLRSSSAPRRAATSVAPVHARSESKQQQAPQPSRAATPQQLRRGTSRRTSTPVQR
eukprot:CAMPEP_0179201642 /NCGR_PEP_ID=MMETSP0796-20121207/100358_1 /TAXON_ID=73915 /ORGANISM="Pyrodinium bahamense, Strain pbaha01" /LENGTH=345 /DNA_ID=CAMNT_0020906205 /DNA_START=55 /DNA_END=1089 /DNA_ORIENTATION=+